MSAQLAGRRARCPIEKTLDVQRRLIQTSWSHMDVLDKGLRHHPQRDLAIDPAEGQVVDLIAERRNVGAFCRVHIHAQHVFAPWIQQPRQLK